MKGGKAGKRIFGGVVLGLLALLTVTIGAFAQGGGSYSLTIVKRLNPELPAEVLAQAMDQKYTFQVNGIDRDGQAIEKEVSITPSGGDSETLEFSNALALTVSEITDDITLTDSQGRHWALTAPKSVEAEMDLADADPVVYVGEDKGTLTLARAANAQEASWFRVTGPLETAPSQEEAQEDGAWEVDSIQSLEPGGSVQWTGLGKGYYRVTELKGPQESSLQLGERQVIAQPDGTGSRFIINGNEGRAAVTAPGTVGDGKVYRYTLRGGRTERTIDVPAGEEGVFENLTKGTYTVTEQVYEGNPAFTVTTPKVMIADFYREITQSTEGRKLGTPYYLTELDKNGNRIRVKIPDDPDVLYGKVSIGNFTGVQIGDKVSFVLSGIWTEDTYDPPQRRARSISTTVKKNGIWSWPGTNPYLAPGCEVSTGIGKDSADGTTKCSKVTGYDVRIDLYRYKEATLTGSKFDTTYTGFTISEGYDWLEIAKPQDTHAQAKNVNYYFTVKDSGGNLVVPDSYTVAGPDGSLVNEDRWDAGDQSFMLKDGETLRLTGLAPGTYKVQESTRETPQGFRLSVTETEYSADTADYSLELLSPRQITLSKSPNSQEEQVLDYTYRFEVLEKVPEGEDRLVRTLDLKAGGQETFTLAAGRYAIQELPLAREPFSVSYTASSTVGLVTTTRKEGGAVVTFTNDFAQGEGEYRVIHEYYLRDQDGNYIHEGSSHVSKVMGLELDGAYTVDGPPAVTEHPTWGAMSTPGLAAGPAQAMG